MSTRPYNDSAIHLSGTPVYLGKIDATTTAKTNAEATTPFGQNEPYLRGKTLVIHASAAVYIGFGSTSTADITTTNGLPLAADERVVISVAGSSLYQYLIAITASGTANVSVWELV